MSELSANVIEYLYAKVSLFLANIELARLNEILNPSISDTDKKTAETKILAIQSNLYTILESSFSQLTNPKNLRQT
ncbi:MAG: hypothetical protein LBF15_05845 [Candidatus Peribacteria bacterium]|jgi:hypothetical protein|nr:hypothetical protein [Candidatus Peribacteria bacterium]